VKDTYENIISQIEPYSKRAYLRWCKVHSSRYNVCIQIIDGVRWISLVKRGYVPLNNGITYIEGDRGKEPKP